MTKYIVYHSSYGCDTGCCGHTVESDDEKQSRFSFSHPYGDDHYEFARDLLREYAVSPAAEVAAAGAGGLSGPPLRARSLAVLRRLHARAGDRLVLIAAGGIETPDDAWERLRAGATLVQAYTAFVYGGPLWPRRMHAGLARRLRSTAS